MSQRGSPRTSASRRAPSPSFYTSQRPDRPVRMPRHQAPVAGDEVEQREHDVADDDFGPSPVVRRGARYVSQIIEKLWLKSDHLHVLSDYAQSMGFQKVAEVTAINQVDGWRSVPHSLSLSVLGESACGQEQPLICTSNHGSSEVPDLARADCAGVPLALKTNVKRKQIDAQHTRAVDAAIARPAGHFHLDEPRLPEDALTQTLECGGGNPTNSRQQGVLPVTFVRRINIFRGWLWIPSSLSAASLLVELLGQRRLPTWAE